MSHARREECVWIPFARLWNNKNVYRLPKELKELDTPAQEVHPQPTCQDIFADFPLPTP